MKKIITTLLILGITSVTAAPIQFDFVFEDASTGATATGYIVFEETLLINPTNENSGPTKGGGDGGYDIPGPEVLDLAFTVSGSASANGDYGMADYQSVVLRTNGGTLNFNTQLIGQATNDQPWGTDDEGVAGDFNLFAGGGIGVTKSNKNTELYNGEFRGLNGSNVPNGCWWFELCTPTDAMVLVSMSGPQVMAQPVPALSNISILILIVSGMLLTMFVVRR